MEDRRSELPERIQTVERDSRDHAKTLTELITAQTTLAGRVTSLEQANSARLILEARQEERAQARVEWQERMEAELNSIRGVGTKLMWIVATGIIGAFVVFMINGGLAP